MTEHDQHLLALAGVAMHAMLSGSVASALKPDPDDVAVASFAQAKAMLREFNRITKNQEPRK